MADDMDNLLRDMGQGTPFPVDWNAYEQELMQRVFRRQAQHRQKMWWTTAAGALGGAVATFLITASFMKQNVAPQQNQLSQQPPRQPAEQIESPDKPSAEPPATTPVRAPQQESVPGEYVRIIGREGGGLTRVTVKEQSGDVQPFTKKTKRGDGRTSEITFVGYSGPDAGEPTYIAAKVRKP